jgi:hypothetical protein
LADLVADGDSVTIAHGGKGGRGNSHFATSTNRVPTHFERGTAGEELELRLELKLLADVGLIGLSRHHPCSESGCRAVCRRPKFCGRRYPGTDRRCA